MDQTAVFILSVIAVAFVFDFINGFHDAANSIATIVTTRVLTPKQAVLWAAFFNFIAFLIFDLTVAKTVGEGLVDTHFIDAHLLMAALLAAILWNLITWYYGLPSSSSHALIGGLAGAAIIQGGFSALKISGFTKVGAGIFISPILGLLIALLLYYLLRRLSLYQKRPRLKKLLQATQLGTSALLSLTHGSNDAQKTMGIITVLLFSSAWIKGPFHVPFWVVISCQAVISLGTLAGGWRIVRTLGTKITHLNVLKGCAAEAGAAATLYAATHFGVPVSTTHTVTGAITGVGLTQGLQKAHWLVLKRIFTAWLLTIPAAALLSALFMVFLK